jgi:hypothetical protein
MSTRPTYIAASRGEVYWRRQVCPHGGAKVLLRTIGGVCVTGNWYGAYGQFFTAWSPMPKDGEPPPDIRAAPFMQRMRFAISLVFQPLKGSQ